MKKIILVTTLLVVTLIITSIFIFSTKQVSAATDYGQSLSYSIQFYDGNKCGPEVGDNQSFNWREACHTKDGDDVGVDLTGGFHDAGDHVKFGLPQGYTASILGWSLYEFGDQMGSSKTKLISTLEYFTDYFKRSHPNSNMFYYQIGDGEQDHTYWGPPEEQSEDRPTMYFANSSNPASDVLGETAAALALMYLNTGDSESLKYAKELYAMGKANEGVGQGQSYYQSGGYADDMAWGACWLAEATGDDSYIDDAETYINIPNKYSDNMYQHKWAVCWDDMYLAAFYKLYQLTNNQKYADAIDYNLNYWINDLTTTPAGMKYLHNWGVLRYNAAQSFLALLRYQQTANEEYKEFAQTQIDYILGDNPENISYMIGYGSSWPLHPHHRAANGMTYENAGNTAEALHTLYGALVGGPDQSDNYIDDVNQYQYTEVAIDYNAGLVGALAGMIKYEGGNVPEIPTVSPTPASTSGSTPETSAISGLDGVEVEYIMNEWDLGATVTLRIINNSTSNINGWTLTFDFPGNQKITNLWNGNYTQTGNAVTVSNLGWNSLIPIGGSVEVGFNLSYTGTNEVPTNFSVN